MLEVKVEKDFRRIKVSTDEIQCLFFERQSEFIFMQAEHIDKISPIMADHLQACFEVASSSKPVKAFSDDHDVISLLNHMGLAPNKERVIFSTSDDGIRCREV